jgi:hypothetical protein
MGRVGSDRLRLLLASVSVDDANSGWSRFFSGLRLFLEVFFEVPDAFFAD